MHTKSIGRVCTTCKTFKPASEFYPHKRMKLGLQPNCKTCSRQWHRDRPDYVRSKNEEYKRKNPTYHRDWQRLAKYGISTEQAQAIRDKQRGLCAGCLCDLSKAKECVDHNHVTGVVRGLLCNKCNVSIGQLQENPNTLRRLANYLESHGTKTDSAPALESSANNEVTPT